MAGKIVDSGYIWDSLLVSVLLAAVTTWSVSVFPLPLSGWGAPSGQGFYLLSKLFGLLAVIALWWQVMGAILSHPTQPHHTEPRIRLKGHKQAGALAVILAAVHGLLFMTAVYFRNNTFPFALLTPDFSSYFKSGVSIGWLSLITLVLVMLSALSRRQLKHVWHYLHRLAYVAVVLAVLHGFMIGSETGFGAFSLIYLFLVLSVATGLVFRFSHLFRRKNAAVQ